MYNILLTYFTRSAMTKPIPLAKIRVMMTVATTIPAMPASDRPTGPGELVVGDAIVAP